MLLSTRLVTQIYTSLVEFPVVFTCYIDTVLKFWQKKKKFGSLSPSPTPHREYLMFNFADKNTDNLAGGCGN